MIKEHTKAEFEEHLRSLITDERELELERWKLRLIKSVLTSRSSGYHPPLSFGVRFGGELI